MQLQTGVAQVAILAFSALLIIPSALQARAQGSNKKPSLSLKATPAVSFAPARVVVVAEVKGGADDNEEFYCPTVEWEWGDFTTSTAEADCEPYEAGKSQIRRRYTVEHQFKNPGSFRIRLVLKKGAKLIATANTLVQVRPGLGTPGGH
jgi:hypothetical protein